jgi:cyanophycinase-like exopeptidase
LIISLTHSFLDEALHNPYDKKITIGSNLFHTLFMKDTITDQHFVQRNRFGIIVNTLL